MFLKLGDPVGASILRGSKCIFHIVEAGKNFSHDAGIVLIEEHRGESILGEGSIDTFVQSRGASREYGLLRARGASMRGKDCLLGGGRSRAGGSSRYRASRSKAKGGEVCLGYSIPSQGREGVCENFRQRGERGELFEENNNIK
jgi:hypothetical protein